MKNASSDKTNIACKVFQNHLPLKDQNTTTTSMMSHRNSPKKGSKECGSRRKSLPGASRASPKIPARLTVRAKISAKILAWKNFNQRILPSQPGSSLWAKPADTVGEYTSYGAQIFECRPWELCNTWRKCFLLVNFCFWRFIKSCSKWILSSNTAVKHRASFVPENVFV